MLKIFSVAIGIFITLTVAKSNFSYSQINKKNKEDVFYAHVKDCIRLEYDFKDSVQVYAFNFKLDVVRTDKLKSKIIKVTANDSMAYKMFPKYKKLYNSDCSFMITGKRKFSIVIPIMVFYKNHLDDPKIDMNAVLNAAQSLYSTKKYSNENDSKYPFGYLFNANIKLYNDLNRPEDMIFLPLRAVEILNLKKANR